MTDQIISDFVNDGHERIMDFDDTELMSPNNNFDFHSFMETNNVRENNNGDFLGTYQEKIDHLSNEKLLMQTHFSNKVKELQTKLVKTKNALEKSEMLKAEIEVEVTKVNKELRISQRQFHLKIDEFEKSKIDLSNHFKTLETEYINQISHLNNLNKMLQEQTSDEKHANFRHQELASDKINLLNEKCKEKEKELSKYKSTVLSLENSNKEYHMNILELTEKVKGLEEKESKNESIIINKNEQLETLRNSENKLKIIIVDLTSKFNQLESQIFEEKHELKEGRSYQSDLQSQLLDLQQKQIIQEKERNLLLDKINQSNRRIKELEESLNNQVNIAANYREHIKKLENERETEENCINETNEDFQRKIEELESKLEIQDRVIEEVNEEISSSRETESVAVSNLTRTLEELEYFIKESSENLKSPKKTPHRNIPRINIIEPINESPRKKEKRYTLKQVSDFDQRSKVKNIMENVRNTILNFQERINNLESERLEKLTRLQSQDREMKNLKTLFRQSTVQQKCLELNNIEKQKEIENLLQEISRIKTQTSDYKQKSEKNISQLKQTLHKTSDEFEDSIESRDNYLHHISALIKDALAKHLTPFLDKDVSMDNQGDPSCAFTQELFIETSTQTATVDKIQKKDNVEVTANLTGTFRFLNENNVDVCLKNDNVHEKRVRSSQDVKEKKHDHQANNNEEEKKKSFIKRNSKQPYVDDCQSWPALREVISSELVTLLKKYDLQRAQCRIMPNDKFTVNCQQLISELSAKESLITRLLSNKNSNSAPFHNQVELMSRGQQTIHNESASKKSPNKLTSSNQNNILKSNLNSKNRFGVVNKTKFENVSSNMSNKRCPKPVDTHKQSHLIQKRLKNKNETSNRKVTTTYINHHSKSIGSQQNPSIYKTVQRSDVNICYFQKPNVISPLNMLEATSKCPEIADHDGETSNEHFFDSRLLSLFIRTLVRLIKTNSKLQSLEDLIYFYKLCYNRSVDCSNLISVNNDLVHLINGGKTFTSENKNKKSKTSRFKVVVHIISVCRYMSRKVLSSKLMVHIYSDNDNYVDFGNFVQTLLDQDAEDISLLSYSKQMISAFIQFCTLNNCQYLIMDDVHKQSRTDKLMSPINIVIYETLKRNVKKLQLISVNQVSKVQFKSQQKCYQANIGSLMIKVKELISIIETQNSLIEMREEEIIQLKESLSKEFEEKGKLINLIKETKILYQNELLYNESQQNLVEKMKRYLSGVINMCEKRIKDGIFNISEVINDEEAIFQQSEWTEYNNLVNLIRDSIKMTLKLSETVKAIIM